MGIVLPEYNTYPPSIFVCSGICQFKSERLQTSMYPPILSTLKLVPVSESLKTELGPESSVADVGFLYSKLMFFLFFVYKYYVSVPPL